MFLFSATISLSVEKYLPHMQLPSCLLLSLLSSGIFVSRFYCKKRKFSKGDTRKVQGNMKKNILRLLKSWRYIYSHLRLPTLEKTSFCSVCVAFPLPFCHHIARDNKKEEEKGKERKFINTIFHRIISFHSCLCHSMVKWWKEEKISNFFVLVLARSFFLLYFPPSFFWGGDITFYTWWMKDTIMDSNEIHLCR